MSTEAAGMPGSPSSLDPSRDSLAPSLRTAVGMDFASASFGRRLALAGVVLWLVYEWGPGNESVTPWLLASVIGRSSSITVIPVTAAVGFVFTTVQQLASGFTALAGFSMFDRTAAAAWRRLRGSSEDAPGAWTTLGPFARCAMVFGLGTTAVALVQIMTTGQVGVRRHAAVVRSSAVLCGALVAVLGAAVATVAHVGRRVDALHGTTEWILRILGNPLFWLTVLAVPVAVRWIVRRVRTH